MIHDNLIRFSTEAVRDQTMTHSSFSRNRLQYELVVRPIVFFRDLERQISKSRSRQEAGTITKAVNLSTTSVYDRPIILLESVSK
jgi:hypothetical protein